MAVCAGAAELFVGRFGYWFGIEEACAAAAVVLVAIGSGLVVDRLPDHRELLVAAVAGAIAAFVAYRRFGYYTPGLRPWPAPASLPLRAGNQLSCTA